MQLVSLLKLNLHAFTQLAAHDAVDHHADTIFPSHDCNSPCIQPRFYEIKSFIRFRLRGFRKSHFVNEILIQLLHLGSCILQHLCQPLDCCRRLQISTIVVDNLSDLSRSKCVKMICLALTARNRSHNQNTCIDCNQWGPCLFHDTKSQNFLLIVRILGEEAKIVRHVCIRIHWDTNHDIADQHLEVVAGNLVRSIIRTRILTYQTNMYMSYIVFLTAQVISWNIKVSFQMLFSKCKVRQTRSAGFWTCRKMVEVLRKTNCQITNFL